MHISLRMLADLLFGYENSGRCLEIHKSCDADLVCVALGKLASVDLP
jgi:hypothetical protein